MLSYLYILYNYIKHGKNMWTPLDAKATSVTAFSNVFPVLHIT